MHVWAEVGFFLFLRFFVRFWLYFFLFLFVLRSILEWLTSQYFWRFLTLRLAAFDVANLRFLLHYGPGSRGQVDGFLRQLPDAGPIESVSLSLSTAMAARQTAL
jgi:hypothetical protein